MKRSRNKPKVLFVAGLSPVANGGHGGQLTAATTLLESPLSAAVDFTLLSSSQQSVPPPPVYRRILPAIRRIASFCRALPSVDAALIFASDGLSAVEKGLMCLLAKCTRRGVVVRFSSGRLPEQCSRSALFRLWIHGVVATADIVVSQGSFWTAFFESFPGTRGKVVEIPNGIQIPHGVGDRPNSNKIAFVGALHREKGIFDALAAFARVVQTHPSARLIVAGDGRDARDFDAAVARFSLQNHVERLGWVEKREVPAMLRSCVAAVLPSYAEGLPNSVLEAMAVGIPVISTRIGAIPDVIRDGENGFLVEPGDIEALRAAMHRVLDNEVSAHQMGIRARQDIISSFSIERAWPRYEEAILRSIAPRRP